MQDDDAPSLPLMRISHNLSRNGFTCGSRMRCGPIVLIISTICASFARNVTRQSFDLCLHDSVQDLDTPSVHAKTLSQ